MNGVKRAESNVRSIDVKVFQTNFKVILGTSVPQFLVVFVDCTKKAIFVSFQQRWRKPFNQIQKMLIVKIKWPLFGVK